MFERPPRRYLLLKLALVLVIAAVVRPGSMLSTAPPPLLVSAVSARAITATLDSADSYVESRASSRSSPIYAKSFVLLDAKSNEVLLAKNPREAIPIASTTKMLSALVAQQIFDLNRVVTVSRQATVVSGSRLNLEVGEQITVENLLKGMLIQSGNDAAYALADAYSQIDGDLGPFVEKMNEFARQNNLNSTVVRDPAGLDDLGRSTAFELSQIAKLLLEVPALSGIVKIAETTILSTDGSVTHKLKNSNRLMLPDSPYFMPSALGIKTGFTPEAGHCLVAAYDLDGRVLIGVILNTNEFTITASASEMHKLFTWAKNNIIVRGY